MKGREIMTKRFGFTLAEVLITLGIIGVVAAMTIPTLMNQTSGAEFKTGFKKMVSTLNQAITMTVALDGGDFASLTAAATNDTLSPYYMFSQRMNIVNTALGQVTATMGNNFSGANNYTLFFNDGMAINFPQAGTACSTQRQDNCRMIIDVNGTKKPNALSTATNETTKAGLKDQFVVDFFSQQVLPHDDKAKYVLYN